MQYYIIGKKNIVISVTNSFLSSSLLIILGTSLTFTHSNTKQPEESKDFWLILTLGYILHLFRKLIKMYEPFIIYSEHTGVV